MSDLQDVLISLSSKIKNYRSLYEKSEQAVRDQIVNPLLRAIGWDIEDPESVHPNLYSDGNVPDYTLLKDKKKILFIEAKKIGENIKKKDVVSQLSRYSVDEGTEYGVLTNGALWVLIKTFEKGKSAPERIIWETDLESDDPVEIARKLSTIAKSNIGRIETLIEKVKIWEEIWGSLSGKLEEPIISGILPKVQETIKSQYPSFKFEDMEIRDSLKKEVQEILSAYESDEPDETTEEPVLGGGPRRMRIKNDVFDFQKSNEILVNAAEWLIKQGRLKPADCPIGWSGKRYLINREPKHKYGDDFRAPKKLSNGLWLDTNYSTAGCKSFAKKLFERFGFPPDILKIESR